MRLEDFGGLAARQPWLAVALTVFLLSLIGIPPTAGFVGKFYLFGAAVRSGYIWLAVIGVLNSAVAAYYYLRIIVYMYMREPDGAPAVMVPSVAGRSPSWWPSGASCSSASCPRRSWTWRRLRSRRY